MTKRSHVDEPDAAEIERNTRREAKRLNQGRKPRLLASKIGVPIADGNPGSKTNAQTNGKVHDKVPNTRAKQDEISTEEQRQALKRAEKLQVKADALAHRLANENGVAEATAKAERKAARRAEKAARKLVQVKRLSEGADADGTALEAFDSHSRPDEDGDKEADYHENTELAALPQAEIDFFTAEKCLAVEDSEARSLRPIISFKYLPLDENQRAPFAAFTAPTPIQAACWPYLFARRDVIGVAETGSGKTLAFGVPCVHHIGRLNSNDRNGIKACIVSPTRELALQIHEQLVELAEPAGLKATCVYGGTSKDAQRATLPGTHIVIATPGRLNDFINEGSIDLSKVEYLVLDEADRMLDKGFEQEVRKIISSTQSTGRRRQTLMFTATWPPSVQNLAFTFLVTPVKIMTGVNASGELRANTRIAQDVEVIEQSEKQGRLIQLLKKFQTGKKKHDRILVFCLYKKEATRIEEFLHRKGFNVAGIHGDLSQQKRNESLAAFKQGKVPLLVATDVAARGLDIPAVKLVINVTFPLTVDDYVHRIGRTGRAGEDGKAITFFTDAEKGLAGALINVLKAANQPVPEGLMKFGTTVKKKGHEAYGAFYKETEDMPKAKKTTFDL